MENVLMYFIKASTLISVYFLAYYFLLRKETFFNTNRWFLLAGLFTSVILPLFFIKKIVWVEKPKVNFNQLVPMTNTNDYPIRQAVEIDWNSILLYIYIAVTIILLFKIVTNFISLFKLLHKKEVIKKEQFSLVDLNEDIAPFSFFNYIVFNSDYYTNDELKSILLHEKIHSQEKHSIDVMIAKFFSIVFWFNPFIWLYKKAIVQNLEYIADQKACSQIEDKKVYQKALLKVVSHQNCLSLTNHFYQSLIKKRIVMLNKNQSHKRNSWKYSLIIPILVAFFITFQIKIIAQEKQRHLPQSSKSSSITQDATQMVWNKNSSDEELKKDVAYMKKVGVNIKFSKVKRNSKGEITTIKIEFKDENGQKGITHIASNEPIKPIYFKKTDRYVGFGKLEERRVARIHRNHDNEDYSFSFSDDEDFDDQDLLSIEEPEAPELPNGSNAPRVPKVPHPNKDGKVYKKSIVITKDGENGEPEVYINGKKMDMPLADLEKMDKDFNGKFEFKSGDNGPFIFKFNDEEMMRFSPEDIEKIKSDAMESSRIHMKKMKEHMEKMRPEMEKMREKMYIDKESRNKEMEKAREEMLKAREEMLKAREEMKKAREEMEKAKSEMKTRKA